VPFDRDHADLTRLIAFARRKKVWLHVDVDIIDPPEMPAVVFPAPRGPSLNAVSDSIAQLMTVADIRGVDVCGYDPRQDESNAMPDAVTGLFAGYRAVAIAI
jgi:arginase family enzyme